MSKIAAIRSQVGILDYAMQSGWERDRVKSSSTVTVLRSGEDKILVTEGRCGYGIFRSERNHSHRGDVVDFAMWAHGWTLQEALQALGGYESPPLPSGKIQPATGSQDGSQHVLEHWQCAKWKPEHGYLRRRGLCESLSDPRFADCYRMDAKGNACFPFHHRAGLCGVELRNREFRGMVRGSVRGFWHSTNLITSHEIVVCESPIDAMSHNELYGGDAAYIALGGEISALQRDLLTGLMSKAARRGVTVIGAFDNDEAGSRFHESLELLSPMSIERLVPVSKDWNEDLLFVLNEA